MKLIIDIGNTRIKSALVDGRRLQPLAAITHSAIVASEPWRSVSDIDEIWIASVAAESLNAAVVQSLQRFDKPAHFVTSPAAACGVRNAYANPQRLGIDRFLSLVAMHAAMENEAVVIATCGTALTLDAMTADGRHVGGLIAPSPALMQSALRSGTAKLVDSVPSRIVEFAVDTDTAVSSGTWLASAALVERFVQRTTIRVGQAPRVIVSGGAGETLGALLEIEHAIEPDLVLRGLAIYADAAP